MIGSMRLAPAARKVLVTLACLLPMVAAPGGASAQQELEVEHDGRLEGYDEQLAAEGSGQALTWIGFAFLSAIALLGLFKDAKRQHGD